MRVGLVRSVGLGMAALFTFGIAGCNDNLIDFDVSEATRITTNPSVINVPVGETQLLESRTVNQGGQPTWDEIEPSLDATCGAGVVTVEVAETYEPQVQPPGVFDVTGVTTGTTCIILAGGGVTGTVEVTVVGPPNISGIAPGNGDIGTLVTISGTDIEATDMVFIDGTPTAVDPLFVASQTDTEISFYVSDLGAGVHTFTVGGDPLSVSDPVSFTLDSDNGPTDPANDDPVTPTPAPAFPFTIVDYLDSGDVDDFFLISVASDVTVDFNMDWNSDADFDILVTDAAFTAFVCTDGATSAQPEHSECDLATGDYLLWINSYDAAAGTYLITGEVQP